MTKGSGRFCKGGWPCAMITKTRLLWKDHQGKELQLFKWLPEDVESAKGLVQIAHGMSETADRYDRFAKVLAEAGYIVFANDHLGHGSLADQAGELGHLNRGGFQQMVEHLSELNAHMREEYPGMRVFVLGHSMGSMLTKLFLYQHPEQFDGVILSGVKARQGVELDVGIQLARCIAGLRGERHRSRLLHFLAFGAYHSKIRPRRTEQDWLSRDTEEVDRYIVDPLCGGVPTTGFFLELFQGLKRSYDLERMKRIPTSMPILLLSGEMDPVGAYGKGPRLLLQLLGQAGLKQVELKLYPEGRHEMLNELNRDEVTADIIHWLNRQQTS
jgi:alpha-beta hydrolase superfamily lysophospholipase